VRSRQLLRYGGALLGVVLAVVLRALLPEGGARAPFLTFFLVTIASAWLGGFGPGAVALAASLVANALVFGPTDRTRSLAYLVVCTVIVIAYGSLRRAKERAEEIQRAELAARETAEAARERTTFLADANVVLTATLDYEQTLASMTGLLVPRLADWCAVDVVEPDGSIRRVAAAHRDPAKAELARLTATYQPDPDGRHPRTQVIRTGRAQLMPEVTDEGLVQIAANAEHLRIMRELRYTSAMIVPLVARGTTLGALTCATTDAGRRYALDDLALAEDLARRAALALDNARLYREAASARAIAEDANQAKDEFLSVVTHELKTPLTATLGWLRVLRTNKTDDIPRALATIERGVRHQAKLIDDLLDVSRMVSGRLRIDRQPVEFARTIETVADLMRPQADAKGVRLDVQAAPLGRAVVGDPDRLQQVVANLVSNAVKFTPANGSIALRLAAVDGRAELVVADTGAGISPEFLPHVFERFRQAAPVTSREKGGLGLGLAITRHLVELHGGTITVSSDGSGRGATFVVRLPLAATAAPEAVAHGTKVAVLDRGRLV
jgi:signal transduction histidine kinase